MDEEQLAAEVRRGAEKCAKSQAPLICAAAIVVELVEHEWPDEDALEVGRRLLRTIKAQHAEAETGELPDV